MGWDGLGNSDWSALAPASLQGISVSNLINEREMELQLFESVLARPLSGRMLCRIGNETRELDEVVAEVQTHLEPILRSRGYVL